MAVALNHLGEIAALQDDHAEAQKLFQRSLSIYQEINDRGGLATALKGLGQTACALGEYAAARKYLRRALQIASDIHFLPLVFAILTNIGDLLLQSDPQEQGVELLVLVRHHPDSEHETKEGADRLLSRHEAALSADAFAAAVERGQAQDLDETIASLQAELTASTEGADTPPSTDTEPADQPLIEPLTPRELEVLRLMADGDTNSDPHGRKEPRTFPYSFCFFVRVSFRFPLVADDNPPL